MGRVLSKDEKINLAVLISGSGSNLQALIDACADENFPARVAVVISNKADAYGLQRAKNAAIPAFVVDHKQRASREDFERAMLEILDQYPVDLVCLAGFMRILSPHFVARWRGRMINTHPSLLPKHGGPGMYGIHVHRAVLSCGDAESGVSIHHVTEECDQGPVVLQRKVPVFKDDTEETLGARVLQQEHLAYVEAVRKFAVNTKI